MRYIGFKASILVSILACTVGAQGHAGVLGLNYSLGPNFILSGSSARDAGIVEPGVSAGLQYGLLPNVDVSMSYDYLHADLHTQALTFGGQFRFPEWQSWTPLVGGGLGFGKPFSGEGWGHFALKLTGGLEKALTENVSFAGVLSYQFVEGPDPVGSVHAFEPGLRMIYYFGSIASERPAKGRAPHRLR